MSSHSRSLQPTSRCVASAPFVARFPWDVYRAIVGTTAGPLAAAIGAVPLLGLVHLWRQRLAFAYVILLLLVPMATMWLGARPADLYPRFFVFVAPFVMALIAGGLSAAFAYYMGPGMTVLHSVDDLDARMRECPRIVVAYHEMRWNSPLDQDMARLLRRRCHADDRGTVTIFRCD